MDGLCPQAVKVGEASRLESVEDGTEPGETQERSAAAGAASNWSSPD